MFNNSNKLEFSDMFEMIEGIPFILNPKYVFEPTELQTEVFNCSKLQKYIIEEIPFTLEEKVVEDAIKDIKRKRMQLQNEKDRIRAKFQDNSISKNSTPDINQSQHNNLAYKTRVHGHSLKFEKSETSLSGIGDLYKNETINFNASTLRQTDMSPSTTELLKPEVAHFPVEDAESFPSLGDDIDVWSVDSFDPFHEAELQSIDDKKELNQILNRALIPNAGGGNHSRNDFSVHQRHTLSSVNNSISGSPFQYTSSLKLSNINIADNSAYQMTETASKSSDHSYKVLGYRPS